MLEEEVSPPQRKPAVTLRVWSKMGHKHYQNLVAQKEETLDQIKGSHISKMFTGGQMLKWKGEK